MLSGEIKAFFRYCPGCGRRFHIKVVEKDLVGTETERIQAEVPHQQVRGGGSFGYIAPITELDETIVSVVEVKRFQYSYKCKHCGHEWAEIHAVGSSR